MTGRLARVRWLVVGSALVASLAGCRPAPPAGPGADGVPRGASTQSLTAGGLQRAYRLYVPPALRLSGPVPLVVMLHGGFGTAAQAEQAYGWDARADADGFVVAYPDGLQRAWNVGGGCCGEPASQGIDDVAFVTAVVSAVAKRLPVDPQRTFATGMSNGAMMAYRLACDSALFAAIAPVAGTVLGSCAPPGPVSVLHIHGLADHNVPFDGSPGSGYARIDGPPVQSVVDSWRSADHCAAPVVTTATPVTTSHATCPGGVAVDLITIDGAGHQWPGGAGKPVVERALGLDPPSTALDATATIWRFFTEHPRG